MVLFQKSVNTEIERVVVTVRVSWIFAQLCIALTKSNKNVFDAIPRVNKHVLPVGTKAC